VTRNYHCREGEIDLIMRQDRMFIFVEVRYRRYKKYGGSIESIDFRKQQRIFIAAQYYVQSLEKSELFTYRFDAVSIEGEVENPHIQWLKDAFRPEA
jgi:putative endonuclease